MAQVHPAVACIACPLFWHTYRCEFSTVTSRSCANLRLVTAALREALEDGSVYSPDVAERAAEPEVAVDAALFALPLGFPSPFAVLSSSSALAEATSSVQLAVRSPMTRKFDILRVNSSSPSNASRLGEAAVPLSSRDKPPRRAAVLPPRLLEGMIAAESASAWAGSNDC